jgi:hypothetical protein
MEAKIGSMFSKRHLEQASPRTLARLCCALESGEPSPLRESLRARLRDSILLRDGELRFLRNEGPGRGHPDRVRTAGLALRALAPHEKNDPLVQALLALVLRGRTGAAWGSPQRTADVLSGLATFVGDAEPPDTVSAEINGLHEVFGRWEDGGASIEVPRGFLTKGENFLVTGRPGTRRIAWVLTGTRENPPASEGVFIDLRFSHMVQAGGLWRPDRTKPDLEVSTPVCVRIRIRLDTPAREVRVDLPAPAGMVFLPPGRVSLPGDALPAGGILHVEERRARIFFPWLPIGESDVTLVAFAVWPGRYAVSPARLDSEVDGIHGASAPGTVTIR